jgi:hypothetical protein
MENLLAKARAPVPQVQRTAARETGKDIMPQMAALKVL